MYHNLYNELKLLLLYTGDYKRKLYLREISRQAKIPLKTTQNLLAAFEEKNILKSNSEGKHKYFSLNLDNIHTRFLLLQTEIYKTILFLQKYPVFKTFAKSIESNDLIIVFGSFANFTAAKDSDLDILTVSENQYNLSAHLIPYRIHQLNISQKSFLKAVEKKEALIKEIETNHVILNNHSFYVNAIWRYYGK
ncbi:MAG: nucleotidyltransferase domain-containing protein [Candidatus Aenigmarchaeota archaeon]|nr:nucleotidyltransferase domain-containing protein [Candidatus Aenigmarchaeota archaeon]